MISGEYSHTVDSKNRIILPAKLREELGTEVVMTKSLDRCVALYPGKFWNSFRDRLDALPETETRRAKRFLYSSAYETEVDSQGRILITPNLCEYAHISKNVKVVGVGDHVEIWDEQLWNEELSSENAGEIINTLIKLGF